MKANGYYINSRGNKATREPPYQAGRKSFHVKGQAIDLSQTADWDDKDKKFIKEVMLEHGFQQYEPRTKEDGTVKKGEWWHYSIGEFKLPESKSDSIVDAYGRYNIEHAAGIAKYRFGKNATKGQIQNIRLAGKAYLSGDAAEIEAKFKEDSAPLSDIDGDVTDAVNAIPEELTTTPDKEDDSAGIWNSTVYPMLKEAYNFLTDPGDAPKAALITPKAEDIYDAATPFTEDTGNMNPNALSAINSQITSEVKTKGQPKFTLPTVADNSDIPVVPSPEVTSVVDSTKEADAKAASDAEVAKLLKDKEIADSIASVNQTNKVSSTQQNSTYPDGVFPGVGAGASEEYLPTIASVTDSSTIAKAEAIKQETERLNAEKTGAVGLPSLYRDPTSKNMLYGDGGLFEQSMHNSYTGLTDESTLLERALRTPYSNPSDMFGVPLNMKVPSAGTKFLNSRFNYKDKPPTQEQVDNIFDDIYNPLGPLATPIATPIDPEVTTPITRTRAKELEAARSTAAGISASDIYKDLYLTYEDPKEQPGTELKEGVGTGFGTRTKDNWFSRNQEMIGLVGSGVAPILSKMLAANSIDDPERIDPTKYVPSIKSKWFDPTAIETKMMQNNATAINTLSKSTGDFDSLSKSVNSSTYGTNTALGETMVGGQKLNMMEQARIDDLVSGALKFNAGQETQADIDVVSRQDKIDQIKRGYITGAGDDVGGIFNDMAASSLAKVLAEKKAALARLTA